MKAFTILIAKMCGMLLGRIGRGSVLPGEIAIKINKNILSYFKLPKITVFVTGTTGKTSISGILTNMYTQNGYKVANNMKGSNLEWGIITCLIMNSNLKGQIKSDVLVLEVDERYVKKVIRDVKPNYFIINNLSRDQLARNGHFDIVWNDINNQITDDIHLVLNSDDPLVTKFGINHNGKKTYYGLSKTKYSKKTVDINNLDVMYCPKCNRHLTFDYFHYGNLGNYRCEHCDFKRPNPDFEAKLINNFSFKVDGQIINMNNPALYNVYNLLASYATAIITGIHKLDAVSALNNLSLKIKRVDKFMVDNKECTILLSKNETPISYNQSLDYISKQERDKTVIIGFNNVSGRYDLKDLSWLWDINFELLKSDSVKKVICVGNFSYDIATRLKYADIDEKKIIIYEDSSELLEAIKKHGNKFVYCIFYFDMEKVFKRLLKEA
ncbi:MAG: MurT ligase domain-containing protein [Bacilli bacterium]|nr:MurT ligase domain-containing protein [Bacilli bacterium]MDD4547748.1 MurT ligase domain-containing protein [Bacilli bacterium]